MGRNAGTAESKTPELAAITAVVALVAAAIILHFVRHLEAVDRWMVRAEPQAAPPTSLRVAHGLFLACAILALMIGCWLGRRVFISEKGRSLAVFGMVVTGYLAVSAVVQSVLLDSGPESVARANAFTMLVLGVPAVAIAAFSVLVTVVRLSVGRRQEELRPGETVLCDQTGDHRDPEHPSWESNWQLPDTRERGGIGVCVSGGGIRSATFSLGALQSLRTPDVLQKARYLVSVSGGGYASGALRLALQYPNDDTNPDTVFRTGTPELDYLRRHGKYLADGTAQWIRALVVVLRGLIAAQLAILLAVVLAGRGIGALYRLMPSDTLTHVPVPYRWAVAAPLIGALVLWMLAVVTESAEATDRYGRILRVGVRFLAFAAAFLVFAGLVVPLLVAASDRLPSLVSGTRAQEATAGVAAVLTTGYVATLAGIFLTVRRIAGSAMNWAKENKATVARIPAALLQRLLVMLGVLIMTAAHLYVFARVVDRTATGSSVWPGQTMFLVLVGVFGALALLVDQTRWSLHPFYKRRLASAFAVRRKGNTAEAYDWSVETSLHEFAARPDDGRWPQVIFMASANVSGQDVTAPGRRVLPYSMSADWLGSPRLGWVRTETLTNTVKLPLRLDLTVQAAMAVSGAAFASAMGASATPYSVLFALTNARLGTWLPNPYHLYHQPRATDWRNPPLPRLRRLHYLIREIFGIYPWNGQLLLVTDGGHYDNLGLVELLRHGPEVAICLDASGGSTLPASALGPAITLAQQELGITIEFDQPGPSALDPHRDRLAASDVLTATIRYPERRPEGVPETGRLYLGRAGLTPHTPWPVLAYAKRHASFPNDSTGDQWFTDEQFDAYHALGRHVGDCVVAALRSDPHLLTTADQLVRPEAVPAG